MTTDGINDFPWEFEAGYIFFVLNSRNVQGIYFVYVVVDQKYTD